MGWEAFIASLVKSLAWPVAALIMVILLRAQIAGVITALGERVTNALQKVSGPGFALEFAKGAEEVSRAAEQLTAATEQATEPRTAAPGQFYARERLLKLAELEPRAAVFAAFGEIEDALRRAAERTMGLKGQPPPGFFSPQAVADELAKRGILDPTSFRALSELISLRDRLASYTDQPISIEAAKNYVEAVTAMVWVLDTLSPETSPLNKPS
jgi:hypothetical protein